MVYRGKEFGVRVIKKRKHRKAKHIVDCGKRPVKEGKSSLETGCKFFDISCLDKI